MAADVRKGWQVTKKAKKARKPGKKLYVFWEDWLLNTWIQWTFPALSSSFVSSP
jgi:hypothetical protein